MSKSQDLTPLLECARKVITDELDILKQFLSRIRALGINVETNLAYRCNGMYATTFILPQKEIVIKFFEKEPEEKGVAKLPNDSRYMLQPYCVTNILGNRLAIFPLLKTMQIDSSHVSQLSAGLEKEGCLFDDAKFDNVGLTECGLPYVIDEDAVLITQGKLKGDSSKRESQWQIIKPYFETDEKFDPEKSGWDFDPVFLGKMTTLSPQPLSASLLKTPSHSPDVAKVF